MLTKAGINIFLPQDQISKWLRKTDFVCDTRVWPGNRY